jgi:hypothetical protein
MLLGQPCVLRRPSTFTVTELSIEIVPSDLQLELHPAPALAAVEGPDELGLLALLLLRG